MANNHGGKRAGAGKKPIGDQPMKVVTVRLSKDDIAYLNSINPDNLADAIRGVIQIARDEEDRRDMFDWRY